MTVSRYAIIDEPLTGSSATICGGTGNGIGRSSGRERHVYTSRSHRVGVQLLHTNNGAGFLLKFEGILLTFAVHSPILRENITSIFLHMNIDSSRFENGMSTACGSHNLKH